MPAGGRSPCVKDPAKIAALFPAAAKLRVVNIWATWCVPCVAEMPELRAVDEASAPRWSMAGVSMDDMIPERDADEVWVASSTGRRSAIPIFTTRGNADDLAELLPTSTARSR